MGLWVDLTHEEASKLIPGLKELISTKIGRVSQELADIDKIKAQFAENYNKLKLALEPLLEDLNTLDDIQQAQ